VTRLLLLVFVLASTVGCVNSEVGDYRLDDVILLAATCGAGVPLDRASAWTSAMSTDVLDDMAVTRGRGPSTAGSQAQFWRSSDGTVFFTDIEGNDDRVFSGERVALATTVQESGLGSDFSSLLEPDSIGCEFDLSVTVEFDFGEEGFGVAAGSVFVEVSETQELSDDRCPVQTCTADWSFAAAHTSGSGGERFADGDL